MKKALLLSLFVGLVFTKKALSQENMEKPAGYMGYIEFGGGMSYTAKSHSVYRLNLGYNSIINEKYLVGLNFLYAFEPSFTGREYANHVNNYTLPYINFGIRNKVGNVYITPSVGVGQANYRVTTFTQESTLQLGLSSTSADLNVKKKYDIVTDKQIAVPINLNVLLTGKYAGVGLNLFMVASKYTEVGAGVSFCLGKVRK